MEHLENTGCREDGPENEANYQMVRALADALDAPPAPMTWEERVRLACAAIALDRDDSAYDATDVRQARAVLAAAFPDLAPPTEP